MPKCKHQIHGRVRTAYELVKSRRDQHSVQMMCRILEVVPSGTIGTIGLNRFAVAPKPSIHCLPAQLDFSTH